MLTTWVLIVFLAYFAALIGIAVFRSRQMQEMSDYVLGGRRVGSITSALSSGSSATSGWTMLVFPALAFMNGAVEFWTVLSIVLRFLVDLDDLCQAVAPVYYCRGELPNVSGIL